MHSNFKYAYIVLQWAVSAFLFNHLKYTEVVTIENAGTRVISMEN